MRSVEIFGRGTPDDFRYAKLHLNQQETHGGLPQKGETKKSPEDLQFLQSIHSLISAEHSYLNLSHPQPISPSRIHLFLQQEKKSPINNQKNGFFTNVIDHTLQIHVSPNTPKETYFFYLLQGMLELHAFHSFHLYETFAPTVPARSGYHNLDLRKTYSRDHFRGFQNAMTHTLATELYNQHWFSFASLYGFKHPSIQQQEEISLSQPKLSHLQQDLVQNIVTNISNHTLKPREHVWKSVKKGYFTGNILPLKYLEKKFGPGTLRLLADIGSGLSKSKYINEIQDFLHLLKTEDLNEKEQYAYNHLSDQEWYIFLRILEASKGSSNTKKDSP